MEKVSILICSYNTGKYIIPTIKSILSQTYVNLELLILDNNSQDDTISNIKNFNDNRIKLFESKENLGPYGGLNFLLNNATGKYIAVQDHDDIWHYQKLEKQINFLEQNKDYIGCGTETIMYYEIDKKYFLYYLGEKNYYTIHPSLVFRNNGNYRYDEKLIYFGDAYFQKKVLCNGEKLIYNIKEPLTLHLIKKGYTNFTFSRFKINKIFLKRIIDVHGTSFYTFLAIGYEIIKKFLLFIIMKINNYKLYVWFDRLPYKLIGNKFEDIKNCKNKNILDMHNMIKG